MNIIKRKKIFENLKIQKWLSVIFNLNISLQKENLSIFP